MRMEKRRDNEGGGERCQRSMRQMEEEGKK